MPHGAYRASLSPRSIRSDDWPLIATVIAAASIFLICIFIIALYRRDVFKAWSENKKLLKSLNLTKRELKEAIELQETQRKDILRLHNMGARYVAEYGPLPSAVVGRVAAEIGEWLEGGNCEQEGNPSPEDGDAFVVGGDAEVENEARDGDSVVSGASTIPTEDRNSFVSDMSLVETDPAAPRVATIGVMRTAARLSVEAARFADWRTAWNLEHDEHAIGFHYRTILESNEYISGQIAEGCSILFASVKHQTSSSDPDIPCARLVIDRSRKPSAVLGCPLLGSPKDLRLKISSTYQTGIRPTSRARRLTDLIFVAKRYVAEPLSLNLMEHLPTYNRRTRCAKNSDEAH
ncbi:hypothetical protein LX32DRAFT_721241 [Colletotrichum zoysiae]|uniref:Uncharacterized protein n=1 Tax=Colletotrichum zoysiae TaxID=1216348 RepID=A0AAD9HSL2_9PEZI|nr:hypothetical protein LX32DRAFT_721241 [Colletotrichum zoysiae]